MKRRNFFTKLVGGMALAAGALFAAKAAKPAPVVNASKGLRELGRARGPYCWRFEEVEYDAEGRIIAASYWISVDRAAGKAEFCKEMMGLLPDLP